MHLPGSDPSIPSPPSRPWDLLSRTYDLALHAQSLPQTRRAHACAAVRGLLHRHLPTCATLLLAYSASGDSPSARRLFEQSPLKHHSAFLWNALVRALSRATYHPEALRLYNRMLGSGVRPDDRTFPFVLKACADAGNARKGRELHGSVVKFGFWNDVFVGNTLLAFYGSCPDYRGAHQVFDEMPARDVVSWNSIISVSSANGLFLDSVNWFLELTRTGLFVNPVSLVSVLPSCSFMEDDAFGRGIHGYAVKAGLDSQNTVCNVFVDMYGKSGRLDDSLRVFSSIREKNDVSWNSVISTLVHAACFGDALSVFRNMLSDGVKSNSVTISTLLPALVELRFLNLGREVHGYSIRNEVDTDVFVSNSLVDMYAKFGFLEKGEGVFYGMKIRNEVSWNAMIANFTQNGAELEAIRLVSDMQANGERPNSVTFTNVLPACARIASLKKGKEIHASSIRCGSNADLFVSNALIDMYAKCEKLKLARNVFNVSERDEVSYNTLIIGYSQSSCCSEALTLFKQMGIAGFEHDTVSFMGVLAACANMSVLKQGKEMHCLTVKKLFSTHLFVANSLLDLYVKCGELKHARKIFDGISNRDVASWNSMILGYGMQGKLETALDLFDTMKDDGVEYDHVSYIAVLSACSHGGMLERGKKYFDEMLASKIRPTQMHFACMVDLLGRAGLMKEAAELIRDMPFEADSNVWGALLGACRNHGNIELGRWAAEHLFELKPGHSGYYVLLSNMYSEAGRWDEANEIRELMKFRCVKQNPGCSWMDTGNKMCAFTARDTMEAPVEVLFYAEHD